jgi:hypothetical protein
MKELDRARRNNFPSSREKNSVVAMQQRSYPGSGRHVPFDRRQTVAALQQVEWKRENGVPRAPRIQERT